MSGSINTNTAWQGARARSHIVGGRIAYVSSYFQYGSFGSNCTYPAGRTGNAQIASVSGNGTSASATVSATSGSGINATGTVSTKLATGILNLSSSDTLKNYSAGQQTSVAESSGWTDTLHYIVTGATTNTVTALTMSFTLNGSMAWNNLFVDPSGRGNGEILGSFIFGGSSTNFDLKSNGYVTTASLGPGSWTTNLDLTTATFSETYDVTGASGDIPVSMLATLWCNNGMICNYSVDPVLTYPGDVTFTSDSGVFLTAGATPLRAAFPLFASGLGALGLLGWRRKRKAQAAA